MGDINEDTNRSGGGDDLDAIEDSLYQKSQMES